MLCDARGPSPGNWRLRFFPRGRTIVGNLWEPCVHCVLTLINFEVGICDRKLPDLLHIQQC